MNSRLSLPLLALAFAILLSGANGCSSDPNVEGAKLYIRSEQYDDALENLDNALAEDPNNGDALALKARVLLLKADKTRGVIARVDSLSPVEDESMETYVAKEQVSYLIEARDVLNHAISVAPDNAEVADTKLFAWASMINTGNKLLQNPDVEPNIFVPLFEAANSYAPDSSQGYYGLGLAHLRAGNTGGAITALEQSWEMNQDPNAAQFLTQAYLSNGQTAEATAFLDEAIAAYPDNQELQALKLSAAGDVDAYEAQVAANPDDAMLRYNYGTLLIEEERYDDAIEQLTRAHELEASADAAYNIGVAHFQKAALIQEEADALSADQQAEYDAVMSRRNAELEAARDAFVEARNLGDATQETTICNSLFQVYSALGQEAEAREAADCAGIDFDNGQ